MMALALVASLALAPVAFAQQGGQTFQADLAPLNGSGASGTATLTLEGDQLTADIHSQGLAPDQPHAQHIHGMAQAISECPTLAADADGSGAISTAEGQPAYGPVNTSLTTTGDTSAESGLAVDRFPVADANGNVSYSRIFALSNDVANNLGNFAIVQHGIDFNGNGEYDFDAGVSSLDPSLPFEATAPANCGRIVATSAALPSTGGISPLTFSLYGGAALVSLGAITGLLIRRTRNA
jgi:hypothetical protein